MDIKVGDVLKNTSNVLRRITKIENGFFYYECICGEKNKFNSMLRTDQQIYKNINDGLWVLVDSSEWVSEAKRIYSHMIRDV